MLECSDAMHVGVAVLQLDLEKAFDCVSHQVLVSILDYINVGSVIRGGSSGVPEWHNAVSVEQGIGSAH